MLIEREIEIGRPVEELYAFVSDPRNDPRWCPKVRSVEQVVGAVPRVLFPLWRHGIVRDVARQLRDLKKVLEGG